MGDKILYNYNECYNFKEVSGYNEIKFIPMNRLLFQLDYIGMIRGDILMEVLPQDKLIKSIFETQNVYYNENNDIDELKKNQNYMTSLDISEKNYKKIIMLSAEKKLFIGEYIMVEIYVSDIKKANDLETIKIFGTLTTRDDAGTRLYPGFCYIIT